MTECKGDGDCFNKCFYENHQGHIFCKTGECEHACQLIKCCDDNCKVLCPKYLLNRHDGLCPICVVYNYNNCLK
jgi:hypothetical protein